MPTDCNAVRSCQLITERVIKNDLQQNRVITVNIFSSGFMPYIHPTPFVQDQDYSYFVLGADLIFLGKNTVV